MIDSGGYAVRENIFSRDECESILAKLSESLDISRAGVRNLMRVEAVARVANDHRLLGLAHELAGISAIPFKATLFNKVGKANWLVAWHQDTALPVEDKVPEGWGPTSVKEGVKFAHAPTRILNKILALRIHLDHSTSSNGPLRVIPGSHQNRILEDAEFRQVIENGSQIELTVNCGGVIAMRPLLVHSSSKCRQDEPRRVLHIEYAEAMATEDGVRLALA